MSKPVPTDSIYQGKQYLRANFNKGVQCPCCDQLVKLYKRKLNSGMAYALIHLYNSNIEGWINVRNYFRENSIRDNNDWTRLGKWGLIEENKGDPEHGGKTMGEWRITNKGRAFVRNEVRVPSHIYFFDNRFYGWSETTTNCRESLSKHFDYEELMNPKL